MRACTREDLSRHPSRLLSSGRNQTKADVLAIEIDGARVVVKDFRGRGLLVRSTIGRFSIARECRAYERLVSLPGIPTFLGRIDAHALAYSFIPGSLLPEHRRHSLPATFFRSLADLLDEVHERGVAMADLHHRNVILVEGTGRPALVDFSLALFRPSRWNLPGRWLFESARRLDRIALERIRRRYESPAEARSAASAEPRASKERVREPRTRSIPPTDPLADLPRLYLSGRALKRWLRHLRGKS